MRVLVAHNLYRSGQPSGENQVVEEELALLRARDDVELEVLLRSSDEIRRDRPAVALDAALGSVWAPGGVRAFTRMLRRFRPDVVHLHNPFPLLSPQVLRVASRYDVPVVQSVHNYRHSCVSGIHFRDGAECRLCLGRRLQTPAVVHACYRGSRVQSAAMVAGRAVHERAWQSVASFLAVSRHQAVLLASGGLPADRIHVKPNSVPDHGAAPDLGDDVLFLGRLAEEKGVRELVGAWRSVRGELPGRLRIAGDGELRSWLETTRREDDRVDVLGNVPPDRVAELFAGVGLVVVPSLWPEPFGRTAVEAMSAGRSVLVSDRGALPELATADGVAVRAPTAAALADGIRSAFASDLAANGDRARSEYLARYTPTAVVEQLVDHYRAVAGARP